MAFFGSGKWYFYFTREDCFVEHGIAGMKLVYNLEIY